MTAIITNKFRIHNAEQFKEAFNEAAPTNMYLFIGRPQAWADDLNPDSPKDTVQNEFRFYDDMIAMKRVQAGDVANVIVRRNWQSGKFYDAYRHNYDGTVAGVNIDNGAATFPLSLYEANFFVITDEYNVYKCISNNGGVASTEKPTGTSTSIITTADGYRWKYMYTISTSDVLKFASTDFIPVKRVATDPGISDTYYSQYQVEQAAVNGTIEVINVTAGGSGYGANQTAIPVTITGDGTGATAVAHSNSSGNVTKVVISNVGTNYTYATVTIGGDGSSAAASAIISPKGGHGYNAVKELGGFYVMLNVRLEYDDGAGDFPVTNDYRRIGIVRDPVNFGTTTVSTAPTLDATKSVTLDVSVSGSFIADEQITGGTSGAVAKVISWNPTTRKLRYYQTSTEGARAFQTGETVTGASSSASGSVTSLGNPEVQPDSGDIIYVEHRRPINRAPDQIEDIKLVVEF